MWYENVIVILLFLLSIILALLLLIAKIRFFELCEKCCLMLGNYSYETGFFGFECKCYKPFENYTSNENISKILEEIFTNSSLH